MKDETNGVPILKFFGLRSKMYSLLLPDMTSKQTAKGVDRNYVKQCISHEQYRNCVQENHRTTAQFKSIRSFHQELFTLDISKIALSPYDDKRYILLSDSTDTLAYGHHSIPMK